MEGDQELEKRSQETRRGCGRKRKERRQEEEEGEEKRAERQRGDDRNQTVLGHNHVSSLKTKRCCEHC